MTDELTNIFADIQRIQLDRADYDKMIEYLSNSIDYLSAIQDHWDHLARLFENMQTLLTDQLLNYSKGFVKVAGNVV
jgi:histone deacetylase complex regulatory component SIN3